MISPWSYDINGRTWTNADFDGYLYIKNRPALIGDLLAQTTAGPTSTSVSSITIGTGSKSFTIGTGVPFIVGAQVRISRQSDSAVWMNGVITAYNNVTGAITVNVEDVNGSGGPFTNWNIQLSGKTGSAGAGGSFVETLALGATATEVSNDSTEQTLFTYTLAGGKLGTANAARFRVQGYTYNNTGGNVYWTIRIKYGSTTLWEESHALNQNGTLFGGFKIDGLLLADASATAQSMIANVHIQRPMTTAAGYGGLVNSTNNVEASASGLATENSATALALTVTMQMGSADPNARFRKLGHIVEFLPAA